MRNIRNIILSLMVAMAGVIPATAIQASATDVGGVSESSSEPRSTNILSTNLVNTPTKWKTVQFRMGPSYEYWKKVAWCETHGDWKNKGYYSGGLGMAQSTWEGYGGLEFGKHPYDATQFEQIVVANRVAVYGYQTNQFRTLDDKLNNRPFFRPAVGFSGWGCVKHNTYLKYKKATKLSVKLPVGSEFYCPQFEPLFKKYSMPAKVFSYIAWRESRCQPAALNSTLNSDGSTDSGLLQINSCWHNVVNQQLGFHYDMLVIPEKNIMFASWLLHYTDGRLKNWNIRAKV